MVNVPNKDVFPLLKELVKNISNRIKKKRYSILGHEKYLREITNMCEGNRRLCKKYKKSIDDTKASIYTLRNWIQDALQLNRNICYIMSEINKTNDLYICTDRIDLNDQGNVKILLDPEFIQHKIDLDVHTHVVKQRSDKWFKLRKEARVTGSTMYRSLGLDTLKKQKEHYDEFVSKKTQQKFPEDVQKKLDYGKENEVSNII